MKKALVLLLFLLIGAAAVAYFVIPRKIGERSRMANTHAAEKRNNDAHVKKLRSQASQLKQYAKRKGFSVKYAFLIDMTIPSGKKRFFVYDLKKDTVLHAGLVAHGSCNQKFRRTAWFSNKKNSGCSSEGIYKIGNPYPGRFGKAYKLFGLNSSNSNAFARYVVLHAYDCVPDKETFPISLCNSLGCPMISYKFLDTLSAIIDKSSKPILLKISNSE